MRVDGGWGGGGQHVEMMVVGGWRKLVTWRLEADGMKKIEKKKTEIEKEMVVEEEKMRRRGERRWRKG